MGPIGQLACRRGWPAPLSASSSYVYSPPPPRFNLHHCFKSVCFEGSELVVPTIYSSPYPLPEDILETLIHISHSDQHTLGGIGIELSNVVE